MLLRLAALFFLIGATSSALAQEAISNGLPQTGYAQPAADSAWVDLRQQPAANSRPQSAPNWVEAVNMTANGTGKTIFRIHVSAPSPETQVMFVRLFFDDNDKPERVLNDVFWSLLNAKEFVFNH